VVSQSETEADRTGLHFADLVTSPSAAAHATARHMNWLLSSAGAALYKPILSPAAQLLEQVTLLSLSVDLRHSSVLRRQSF
jgi:hypothetical protein